MTNVNEEDAGKYQPGGYEKPAKMKTWDECTLIEQLQRIRIELQNARHYARQNSSRFSRIESMLDRFEHHQHGTDGAVLIRIRDTERGYGISPQAASDFDPLV